MLRKYITNNKRMFEKLNKLIVNLKEYLVEGTNVKVENVNNSNVTITVNGKTVVSGLSGNVHITWEGPLANLDCNSCTINGDVKGNVDANSVKCGNVGGNVDGNSVTCGDVKGKIDAVSVNRK